MHDFLQNPWSRIHLEKLILAHLVNKFAILEANHLPPRILYYRGKERVELYLQYSTSLHGIRLSLKFDRKVTLKYLLKVAIQQQTYDIAVTIQEPSKVT